MRLLRALITLAPYGGSLRSSMTDTWIFLARIQIFVLAVTSGAVWAILASSFGSHDKTVLALATGLFAFVITWVIAADIVMFDLYAPRHLKSSAAVQHGTKYVGIILRMLVLLTLESASVPPIAAVFGRAATILPIMLIATTLVLKLTQPRSVLIYFSEDLQDAYWHYRSGALDKAVEEDSAVEMPPLAFEAWYRTIYRPRFLYDRMLARFASYDDELIANAERLQSAMLLALNESSLNPARSERRLLNG